MAKATRAVRGLVCATLMGTVGCATVVRGRSESVHVRTTYEDNDVSGATCTLKIGSERWSVTTPESVQLPRQGDMLLVRCVKDGYQKARESVQPETQAGRTAVGGAATGAGVAAVAGLPLLVFPVVGWAAYGTVVGGGALVGGAASTGTDAATGAIYDYPSEIVVPLEPVAAPTAETAMPADPNAPAPPATAVVVPKTS